MRGAARSAAISSYTRASASRGPACDGLDAASPGGPDWSGRAATSSPLYLRVACRLSSPASGAISEVALVTLSILGGCLEGSGLPAAGQKCELNTEWQGRPLLIQGEVVWKTKDRAGVRFAALEGESEKLLRGLCADLRLQPLAPLPPEPN